MFRFFLFPSDSSIQLHAVDVLARVGVVHPSLLAHVVPPLVEEFGRLLQPPCNLQLASAISLALVCTTQTCVDWELYQTLLSEGLIQKLVAKCVMSCDVISPVLNDIATVMSLYTQVADER